MRQTLIVAAICGLGWIAPVHAAPPPPPPVVCKVTELDPVLDPAGGTLQLSLSLIKGGGPLPDGPVTVAPSFTDGWGRLFWEGDRVTVAPGDKARPAAVEFAIPYPPLPVGGYIFTARVRDAAGQELVTHRVPTGRVARFDFRRDLAWMIFGCNPGSDARARALRDVGFNGAGGYALDYRFPYRWFQDHAMQVPTEGYPEAVVLHPAGTAYEGFVNWFSGIPQADGGLILTLLTEEIGAKFGDPAMRAARLRLVRTDPSLNVAKLSRFNFCFQTDFLTWDEVFRDGFPPLNNATYGAKLIQWTADRGFRDVEVPMMRAEAIRRLQPTTVIGPGATHSVQDANFDSMNRRAYNTMTTLDFLAPFLATQKNYGLRPGHRLVNLKPAAIDGRPFFPAHEHLYWASLAVNDRLFQIYCPGDQFGSLPVKPDGQITDEGAFLQGVRRTIHGLRPVILETRTRVEPTVFWSFNPSADPNLADALAVCGVVPNGNGRPDADTRLIFSIGGKPDAACLAAARAGAGLVLQGNDRESLADLGIEAAAEPPPEASPETAADADDNEGNAEGLASLESTAGAAKTEAEIDLAPLATAFPGLAGVKVLGNLGPNARARADSGLEEIRVGGKLVAITGRLGKGWVLFLNFRLQNMLLPNGWRGSWGSQNLSQLGDASVPERNAALARALLDRAGVAERFRIVDAGGTAHPFVRAFEAEPHGGGQRYLYIVSESAGRVVPDEDPKKLVMALATDRQYTARLRIFDRAVEAVRDLRAGTMLPVQADAQGATVDLELAAGSGTILALLPAAPAEPLALHLSQGDVAGIEDLHVALGPRPDGHTCWVRFLDPQGREVEPLSRWATGPAPLVFTATFALDDPEGEWTVVAEDMTDGTRAEAKFRRQAKPAGPRFRFTPAGRLVRGAANRGALPGEGLTAQCDTPGVRATLGAGGQLELDVASGAPAGPAFVALRRGESVVGGVRVDIPEPFAVTFAPTPYLDGDLIVTEIRGVVRSTAAAATPITLRLPTRAGGQRITVTSPEAHADVPFAIPLFLSRAEAQALCGMRHEGVELTVEAPGLPSSSVTWTPNILPLERAPRRIGTVQGGTLAIRINNFTATEQRITTTLAPLPGESADPWQATATVAPHDSTTVERTVDRLDATIDPGLHDVPLEWTAGGVARGRTTLTVEEVLEQAWWVEFEPPPRPRLDLVEDPLEPDAGAEVPPALPADPQARTDAGWRRVVTQSVLHWNSLAPPKAPRGRIYAATVVDSPGPRQVKVGHVGPTPPQAIWVNDVLQTMRPPPQPPPKDKPPVVSDKPVALREGANTLIVALDIPQPKPPVTSLFLQDPATGKRDREVRIGQR